MPTTLLDAHCHLDQNQTLLATLVKHNIPATINCQNRLEWETYFPLTKKYPSLQTSFGIHPWDADLYSVHEFLDIYQETAIIGEIGLDNTWTSTDLSVQRQIFQSQLTTACDLKKPIVLHTKGMEKEIAEVISQFPNTYLVHWYSAMDHLEKYIELDCYFTVGPSVLTDPAVKQVLLTVPKNRLLIESDGLDALAWAHGIDITMINYLDLQQALLEQCADLLNMDEYTFSELIQTNYQNWLTCSSF